MSFETNVFGSTVKKKALKEIFGCIKYIIFRKYVGYHYIKHFKFPHKSYTLNNEVYRSVLDNFLKR